MTGQAPEGERIARAALSRLGEPGDPRLTSLVAELGAGTVVDYLRDEKDIAGTYSDVAQRLRDLDAVGDLETAATKGIRYVVPGDDEWPAALGDLDVCETVGDRGGAPLGLWVRGPLRLEEAAANAVAIVGSRSATSYGADASRDLAATVATAGVTVVSGAAFGIDQAAHRGALAARGSTVAVLACGVDRAYPAAHANLLDYIADAGLVISELPPGSTPTRLRFLTRNRMIAALAQGTVVVEAAIRSGALNTASWAESLSRRLMGVPGPVTSAPSAGVHQLIRSRGASLVTSGAEVLELLAPAGSRVVERLRAPEHPRDGLSRRDQEVLEALPVNHGVDAARIAHHAGLPVDVVRGVLGRLLQLGLAEHSAGRWRVVLDEALPGA